MPEHVRGHGLDVLRRDVGPARHQGLDASRGGKEDRRARRRSVLDQRLELLQADSGRLPRREHEVDNVLLDLRVEVDRVGHVARAADVLRTHHRLDRGPLATGHPAHDLHLLLAVRIVHAELQHEAVDLCLRQRVRPLLFDRVLGRQDKKRVRQIEGLVAQRDLPFLHRLEQRALDLGRRAVDLVGEQQVGEDRSLLDLEVVLVGPVDLGSQQVRRQQVRRELDARKAGVNRFREGLDRRRLGQARNALDQYVAVGDERHQQPIDHVGLTDDHLGHLGADPLQQIGLGGDLRAQLFADTRHGWAGRRRTGRRQRLFGWNVLARIHRHLGRFSQPPESPGSSRPGSSRTAGATNFIRGPGRNRATASDDRTVRSRTPDRRPRSRHRGVRSS